MMVSLQVSKLQQPVRVTSETYFITVNYEDSNGRLGELQRKFGF